MPTNRLPSTTQLQQLLIPRPPKLCLLPLESILQPTRLLPLSSVHIRLNSRLAKQWKGSGDEDHSIHRQEKGDTTYPGAEGARQGIKEREESEGIADATKSQAKTEREGLKFGRKAKEDHPKAPEPVIGMNDERGEVS
ncbi:hypothetical protein ASPZODRAFT_54275, partial [Penicilliopsis zonata CBS 506.65]